jgi:hypothetical protein
VDAVVKTPDTMWWSNLQWLVETTTQPTDAEAKRNIVAAAMSGSTPASVVTTPASVTASAAGGAIANANNPGSAACAPEED